MSPQKSAQQALRTDSVSAFDDVAMSTTSPTHLGEMTNKIHKLNDARRQWESRHHSNSPFRVEAYASTSSIGMDSCSNEGSPLCTNRGYGMRSGFVNQ